MLLNILCLGNLMTFANFVLARTVAAVSN